MTRQRRAAVAAAWVVALAVTAVACGRGDNGGVIKGTPAGAKTTTTAGTTNGSVLYP